MTFNSVAEAPLGNLRTCILLRKLTYFTKLLRNHASLRNRLALLKHTIIKQIKNFK
jgi:hypothetical protein